MSPPKGSINGEIGGGNNKNLIEHHVSKMDTLAGVAIKYGVEVADIKKLNGLATDLQMFALKTLLIPLPGRHPPSTVVASSSQNGRAACPGGNCSEKTPPRAHELWRSFESVRLKPPKQQASQAMSSLQTYYGLRSSNHKGAEGMEMAVYRTESSDYLNQELLPKGTPGTGSSYCTYKSRNPANGLSPEDAVESDYIPLVDAADVEGEKSSDKSVRRRQKSEAYSRVGTPESNGGTSGFSPVTGKGLSMRAKTVSKASLVPESDLGWLNSIPVGLGESIIPDGPCGVCKSSSTPNFQDHDSSSSSVWPTPKWSLKPDLQSLSTAAINMPIFDGLPKPISGRRSKAALD